jgi:cytolysin (calcineurin-like family phosphatase)
MVSRIILGTTFALISISPCLAGPCTQRLAELEKSISARQEGAGPALDTPTTTGSAAPSSSSASGQGVNVTAESQGHNQAMQMIQRAKQLDQQGKEAECMDMAGKAQAMAPPAIK